MHLCYSSYFRWLEFSVSKMNEACYGLKLTFLDINLQANVTQVEVNIPHKHHNAVIGAKGRLIRSIMDDCGGVSIKFPPEGSNSDTVLIRGPKDDVEKAKMQLLEILNEKVRLYLVNKIFSRPKFRVLKTLRTRCLVWSKKVTVTLVF